MSIAETFTNSVLLAWQGKLEVTQLLDDAAQFEVEGKSILSIILYQIWLEHNTSEYTHAVYFNLGVALAKEEDLVGAERAYLSAIEIDSSFVQPRMNLGSLYEGQGEIDKALEEWRWVTDNISPEDAKRRPLLVLGLNQLGRVLELEEHYPEAVSAFARSLEVEPNQSNIARHLQELRLQPALNARYIGR
jgi:tetratricopeptide (TPR) repeat protein